MRTCRDCGKEYEYKKGPGYSTVRCSECLEKKKKEEDSRFHGPKKFGVSNFGSRPMGYKTRQQHKKVN